MACSIYFIKPHMNYMKQPAEKKTPDRRLYMKRTRILPYISAIQYSYLLGEKRGYVRFVSTKGQKDEPYVLFNLLYFVKKCFVVRR